MTEEQMKKILESAGATCLPKIGPGILFRFGPEEHAVRGLADLGKNSMIFQLRRFGLATVSSRHRPLIRRLLLEENLRYKVTKFAIDEDDGEIIVYVDIPLGPETTITKRQVTRCLTAMLTTSGSLAKRLEQADRSGKDPGHQEDREAAMAAMLHGMRRVVEDIEARQEDGRSDDSPPPSLGKSKAKGDGKGNGRKLRSGGFDGLLMGDLDDDEPS